MDAKGSGTVDAALIGRLATGGVLLVPALITVGLSFNGGGFFPDSIAWAVIALAVIVIVRCALAPSPLQGIGPWVLVPGLALVGLAIWTLLSGLWSDAPGRAVLEFERVALYGLAFLLFGSLGRSSRRLSFAVCAIAAALTLVAALALLSRAAPDILPTSPSFRADRLSFPSGTGTPSASPAPSGSCSPSTCRRASARAGSCGCWRRAPSR